MLQVKVQAVTGSQVFLHLLMGKGRNKMVLGLGLQPFCCWGG